MKPSKLALEFQKLLTALVAKYLDTNAINIVTRGRAEICFMLDHEYRHNFFTGSSNVARFITAAAAKHLTPTVLELGGQRQAIVSKSANVDLAVKRIAYAKFLNAGQVCLSVNHVFAVPAIYDEFVQNSTLGIKKFSGEKGDMCQVVDKRNYDRLTGLLENTEGEIRSGGKTDTEKLLLALTIVANIKMDVLEEVLFGPICPVISADYRTAYEAVNGLPHPLAIYIFSSKQSEVDEILSNTYSGGVIVNDTIIHAGVPSAPFGGVGESGYGVYHGLYGFKTFSHKRVIVSAPNWLDAESQWRSRRLKKESALSSKAYGVGLAGRLR